MKKGRYNIELPKCYDNKIRKFNVYMNDSCKRFIYFEGKYVPIIRKEHYKNGFIYQFKSEVNK